MFFKIVGVLAFGMAVFGLSYQYNKKLVDWLRFQSLGTRDYIVERLNLMFIDIPPHRILIGLFGMSFGAGILTFVAFFPNWLPGLMFGLLVGAVGWKAPKPIVDIIYERRVNTFTIQMVDALSLMSNGLKSGLSIVQSLSLVTQEMPNPIRQEFNLILSENKLGVSLEEAFVNLSRRIKADDVEMFVTSVNILKETGGNLAETFDTIVVTIRDRIKVEGKIKAMTQSGRVQGYVVMAIPAGLGVTFYITDPDFMTPLFTTPLGWAMIFAIVVLEGFGLFLINKIMKVDI